MFIQQHKISYHLYTLYPGGGLCFRWGSTFLLMLGLQITNSKARPQLDSLRPIIILRDIWEFKNAVTTLLTWLGPWLSCLSSSKALKQPVERCCAAEITSREGFETSRMTPFEVAVTQLNASTDQETTFACDCKTTDETTALLPQEEILTSSSCHEHTNHLLLLKAVEDLFFCFDCSGVLKSRHVRNS